MTNANPLILDETTLLGGRLRLLQPKHGLRAGLDAVMLAASVSIKAGQKLLDLGCGSGGAGLSVMVRNQEIHLTGFDIQPQMLEYARMSANLNGWSQNTEFIEGDVRSKTLLPFNYFDSALSNPPYLEAGTWYDSPDSARSLALGAQQKDEAALKDWIDCLQRVVKPQGAVCLIHRADHADKLIQALGTRFGSTEIWPLHSKEGEPANRIVIRTLKNRKSPCKMHQGIVLHTKDGAWTPAACAILQDAKPL